MSIKYYIDTQHGIVVSETDVSPTFEEIADLLERLQVDPDFDPSFGHLADYSSSETRGLTSDELRRLAEFAVFAPTAKRAIVVQAGLQYGLGRMYQLIKGDPDTVRLFASKEEALQWLVED